MGLFHHKQDAPKKSPTDEAMDAEEHFFDEYFQEELRNHGRWYFEKIINENGALFKQDLDATIEAVNKELEAHVTRQFDASLAQVDAYLKEHITKQLDDQFSDYRIAVKGAQDDALEAITTSAKELKDQHEQLTKTLQENVTDQKALLHNAFEDNKSQIAAMKQAQDNALQLLTHSAHALQEQQKELGEALKKNVAEQEATLVAGFQENMARIVEHYLLGAIGDQYDLKAQLPSIIQQMEANKQAIVDDMKL